ncbi:unnamed protein product [Lactuca saligna]|uniref:Uncharacterized protein n=1 Tax=Lactuca saligna TaxID=75948 RepID=A0AA35ZKY5_LACSI|nr:unnamed protein product [Lactuca saligna]
MGRILRDPTWMAAFVEDRICGGKQGRMLAREMKGENHTRHVTWRNRRLENQLTQNQNTLMEMQRLLDTVIAVRMQQDTHIMEDDLKDQATLIKVGVTEEVWRLTED